MAAGKRYSAGAIFLQVVPVFHDVQRLIESEAQGWDRALGDQMEKSGEKAGERAGKAASKKMREELDKGTRDLSGSFEREFHKNIDGINRALGGIDTKRLSNGLRRELSEVKKELAGLKDVDITAEADFKRAYADIAVLEGRVRGLRDNAKIVFRSDIDDALKGFAKVAAAKEAISDPVEIEVRVDNRQMGAFEKSIKTTMAKAAAHIKGSARKEVKALHDDLEDLSSLRVGVDIGAARLRAEVREIMMELEHLAQTDPEIDVRFEAGRAWAEYASWESALDRMDGRDVTVDVNVDTKKAQRGLFGIARSGDDAANSFRSFNIILLAAAGAGPALIPMLAAIAGGLLAIGPAAAVAAGGIGAVLVGFSGLGDALTALQARQDQQSTNAQTAAKRTQAASHAIEDAHRAVADAERNAAEAAEDAARRVKDAREAAADAVENALERQKDAQDRYRKSVDDVREAERALREARRDAAGTGEDLDREIRANSLAMDQAMLDQFNTTVTYNTTKQDGSSTNAEQEQARINMEQARLRMEELRDKAKDLAAEKKKWDKEGVNGTKSVVTAQDRLNAALEAQRDAYKSVRDAAEAVDKAREDGAERVRDAIEAQNRTLADNARAVDRARENLVRAREAQDDLNTSINSQQQAVDNAMAALGPAGRKFALFLFGLKEGFRDFRDDIQTAMLPSVQEAIEGFLGSKNSGVARDALIALAGAFGAFAKALSASFQGPAWAGFFEMLAEFGPQITQAYGDAFIKIMEAFASILTTLAPFADEFAKGLAAMMTAFADWAASKEGQEALLRFLDYVRSIGPDVLNALGALALALLNLLVAVAPYGEMVLDILTKFFEILSELSTGPLGAFIGGLLATITAAQIAYAVMNLLMAGTALLTSTVGLLVFALGGLALAIVWVYRQNETLGTILGIVAGSILAVVAAMKIWRLWTALVLAVQVGVAAAVSGSTSAIVAHSAATRIAAAVTRGFIAVQMAFNAVLAMNPIALIIIAIVALVAAIVILWRKNEAFRNFMIKVWDAIKSAFWDAWEIIKDVFDALGDGVMWLWRNAFRPALHAIGAFFGATFRVMKQVWQSVLWPVIKIIGKVIWNLYKAYFKIALVAIKVLFKATFIAMKWVWEHVLRPAFKGIGIAVGWLWKNVFKPTFGWIGDRFEATFKGMKWVWDRILKPVFDHIGDKALPHLKSAFKVAVDAIETIWEGLKKIVGKPIKFVLDTIINKGLIGGFNKVADWVGMKGFDEIPIPRSLQQYATGGVMPGYTPGRDVHAFYSPTAGRLELSGGEAVMRPEWTAAVGPDYVNRMNAIARRGGTKAVAQAMGGYWMGGVLPLPGGSVSSHGNMYGHPAFDLNYPGYSDYGAAVKAWKDGIVAQMNYIGDQSYGRWAVLNHPGGQNSLYAHLSNFAKIAVGDAVRAGQTIGYVGDLGNTGNPPTSHLHFEISGGAVDYADTATGGQPGGGRSIPGWLMGIVKNPLGAVKNWVTSGWDKATGLISESPVFDYVKKVPLVAAKKVTDKVWDVVPGWVKTAAGWAGNAAEWAVGGVKNALGAAGDLASGVAGGIKDGAGAVGDFLGLAEGGILPYNGTMKYDSGGYLPPGLTSVVNLTGKPEPVFTNDQWGDIEVGGQGGNIHYEPHFEGSNLTAEDIAGDVNFTFRRLKRGGKYAGVGRP